MQLIRFSKIPFIGIIEHPIIVIIFIFTVKTRLSGIIGIKFAKIIPDKPFFRIKNEGFIIENSLFN